ncbi:MAG: hypothetical protein M1826_001120 [Phylliscum demangeonii]|nr:MAG: hypothetical protein M1826_001120 [Phylliscum demangeonii]
MHPDVDPAYITTKSLPADARPEAIEAHEATRRLNNQLTEGRALLELRDVFGEGVFLLYPPNVPHDAILQIPKATRIAAIQSLNKILPALSELCDKAWEVYTAFMARPETAPRVRLELLPCDLIEDGMPVTSLSVLELLDTATDNAVVEEIITPRAQRVSHHVLGLLPPSREPTMADQFKEGKRLLEEALESPRAAASVPITNRQVEDNFRDLMAAASAQLANTATSTLVVPLVDSLLESGADINAHGDDWGTALIAASWGPEKDLGEILVRLHWRLVNADVAFGLAAFAASATNRELVVLGVLARSAVTRHGRAFNALLRARDPPLYDVTAASDPRSAAQQTLHPLRGSCTIFWRKDAR